MTISEKVAYLKGLMEGMKLDTDSGEGKLLHLVADVLGDVAEELEDVESDLCDLSEDIDAVSDALSELEDGFSGNGDDDGGGEDVEPLCVVCTCPACGKKVTLFDENALLPGTIQCPDCGEMIDLGLDEEE